MSQATDAIFLDALQQAFGERAGTFVSASPRALVPLRLRIARRPARARQLLIGNAAQTLHPVAGQGLNLGLRDAWELAEVIGETSADPGTPEIVDAYARKRRNDRRSGVILTDALVRIFSNDIIPLSWLRGCGLTLVDSVPQAKRAFMRQTMFGSPI
jgi:2-octaprenyl-6-methoxyphenol hydroxylase